MEWESRILGKSHARRWPFPVRYTGLRAHKITEFGTIVKNESRLREAPNPSKEVEDIHNVRYLREAFAPVIDISNVELLFRFFHKGGCSRITILVMALRLRPFLFRKP